MFSKVVEKKYILGVFRFEDFRKNLGMGWRRDFPFLACVFIAVISWIDSKWFNEKSPRRYTLKVIGSF